jgi:hypothetical protein
MFLRAAIATSAGATTLRGQVMRQDVSIAERTASKNQSEFLCALTADVTASYACAFRSWMGSE